MRGKNKLKRILIMAVLALLLVSCQTKREEKKMGKYFFENNGVKISVGDDVSVIIKKLGKANRESRAASCAGAGEDIIYIYNGFRLSAYSENGKETVIALEITSDTVSTPEGVRLGDSADTVVEIYGVPERREEGLIEYEGGGVKLRFIMSRGAVKSIKYLL